MCIARPYNMEVLPHLQMHKPHSWSKTPTCINRYVPLYLGEFGMIDADMHFGDQECCILHWPSTRVFNWGPCSKLYDLCGSSSEMFVASLYAIITGQFQFINENDVNGWWKLMLLGSIDWWNISCLSLDGEWSNLFQNSAKYVTKYEHIQQVIVYIRIFSTFILLIVHSAIFHRLIVEFSLLSPSNSKISQ